MISIEQVTIDAAQVTYASSFNVRGCIHDTYGIKLDSFRSERVMLRVFLDTPLVDPDAFRPPLVTYAQDHNTL